MSNTEQSIDEVKPHVIDHILIRDGETSEVLVNKRDHKKVIEKLDESN